MVLSPNQIEKIAEILNNRVSVFVGKGLGKDFLTTQQKNQLNRLGIDLDKLYNLHFDPYFLEYQLGMMSQIFTKVELNRYSFRQFTDAIKRGEYVPLNQREKATLNSIKMESLKDIRSFQNKIFDDVNNIISQADKNNRKAYEKVIQRELKAGMAKRQSYKEIAQNLGRLTGDWARRWDRIVQTQGHTAFDEGRSAIIERKSGENALVYKLTYKGACKHCIRLYRTRGQDSQPIVFKLSELKANGTNVGRKVNDWMPVIGGVHPFCRCTLHHLEEGQEWNGENFVWPKERKLKVQRSKVPIKVGEKEYLV